jgi:hypothetical protein
VRKLLALLLMLMLLPCALAETLPYPESTVISVLALTDAQRRLADFLYGPVLRGETHIALPDKTLYGDVSAAMGCLMQDYPELFHLGRNYSVGYYRDEPEYATWVEPSYRVEASAAAALREQLLRQARLAAGFSPDPDVILDVLCQSVLYGGDEEMRHTAVGPLLQGAATCEGYAQAVTLVCRIKGIPCGVIVGNATDNAGRTDRHAWNLLRMNGYTLLDLTWNDQNNLGLNTRWYYGLSTQQMAADHVPDGNQRIPDCGVQDNWHAQRGLVIASEDELYAALRIFIREGQVNLRFSDRSLYARAAHDTHALLDAFNRACPEDAFYGAYSIVHSDAQLCVILQRAE